MISATGRMPCIAAPIAVPARAISEIGVLRTHLTLILFRAIDLRIADVVADEPVGVEVQQHWALARARVLEGGSRSLVDGLDVLTVDLDRLHAVRLRALRQVADRRMLNLWRRL